METTKDQSFGVVPIFKNGDQWEVLLVEQISYRGSNDRFWTFPKGHPEADENHFETAQRELREETGINEVRLIEEAEFSIEYSFNYEGKRIEKKVSYYLGVCANKETKISLPNEISKLAWMSFSKAMSKLAHKNAQKVLLEAGQFITTNEHKL